MIVGSQLKHFRIVAQLGEGGMGEVYRAEDSKLGREVAIKVLPEAVSADAELLARFAREARVLASLNHPAIAAVHSFESEGSRHFLVMELIEGEDLEARIERGPLPVAEALPLALQMAEGLESAHERGIVHRDLKPGNVRIDLEGRAKILDFGLAKALDVNDSEAISDPSEAPTQAIEVTRRGMILGTAGYMSPEQARGNRVDKRADIWAFGAVLFEMLTGQRLFEGTTTTDVLAAVMRADLDFERLPDQTPRPIVDLLRRCLERDEKNRLRDIGEARISIAGVLADPQGPGYGERTMGPGADLTDGPDSRTARRRVSPWLFAVAGIGVGALLAALLVTRTGVGRPASDRIHVAEGRKVVHTSIGFPPDVRLAGWSSPAIALSPDENTLAFVGVRGDRQELYLRRLDLGQTAVVPESEGAEGPFFSPDGRFVAFGSGAISGISSKDSLLKRAPVAGGVTQSLVPILDYAGGSWGSDGYIYYSGGFLDGGLLRVRETGGAAERLFEDARGDALSEVVSIWPQVVDNGRRVLFTTPHPRGFYTQMVDLETGELHDLDLSGSFARYATNGHLVFTERDGVLRSVPLDQAFRQRAAPVALLRDIAFTANGAPVFSVGGSGSAVFATGFVRGSDRVLSRIARVDPATGAVEHLPFEAEAFRAATPLSPDGRLIAATTWDGTLYLYDFTRKTRLKLPEGDVPGTRLRPRWSPDGETIVFSVRTSGGIHLYAQETDGTSPARLLAGGPGEAFATSFTPDGRFVVFDQFEQIDMVFRVAVSGDDPPQLLELGVPMARAATISPDGEWITYHSNESGRSEVYVEPYAKKGPVTPVSSDGGANPQWSPSGDQLYFSRGCDHLAVSFKPGTRPELGAARKLFERVCESLSRNSFFEVGEDGFFYLLEPVADSGIVTSLQLVQGWTDTIQTEFEP